MKRYYGRFPWGQDFDEFLDKTSFGAAARAADNLPHHTYVQLTQLVLITVRLYRSVRFLLAAIFGLQVITIIAVLGIK